MAPKSLFCLASLFAVACHATAVTPPVAAPDAPPQHAPARPIAPSVPDEPPIDVCTSDQDCGPNGVCTTTIIPACPTCDGGRPVLRCVTLAEGCPRHVDCMPPHYDEGPCPSQWVTDHCPHTRVSH